jgi:hypothetical protein
MKQSVILRDRIKAIEKQYGFEPMENNELLLTSAFTPLIHLFIKLEWTGEFEMRIPHNVDIDLEQANDYVECRSITMCYTRGEEPILKGRITDLNLLMFLLEEWEKHFYRHT